MTTTPDSLTAHQTLRSLVEQAEAGLEALRRIPDYATAARKERGLTQNALAIKMGVHPSVVSSIEGGRHPVSIERARKLIAALANGG